MDWIVPVSAAERGGGMLRPETERAALAMLREHGCVLLRRAFDPALIDALKREFAARYGALDALAMKQMADRPPPNPLLEVGVGRFELTVTMAGIFAQPILFANPLLRRFLAGQLGADMRLSGFTAVVSHPGAELQHSHRDHAYLFSDDDPSLNLPAYAINCAVPLLDVDDAMGPTAVWPGSHKWTENVAASPEGMRSCAFERGDCLLLDYRTLHTGLPNTSAAARPILYMVYARTWFFDEVNHIGRAALDMPLAEFARMPREVHPLLVRAYSQAMRARLPG